MWHRPERQSVVLLPETAVVFDSKTPAYRIKNGKKTNQHRVAMGSFYSGFPAHNGSGA